MKLTRYTLALAALAASVWAQPRVDAVLNAASYAIPPAPNSPIAKGSLFVLFGANMGPAAIVQSSYPLPANLGGTSIQVTVNGTTTNAIMVYTLAGQVAAVLPSNTPAGTGTLRVTYNSQDSATIPITVVDSNPAIFTVNARGFGDGIITFTDYGLVTPTRPAEPGDNLIVWATGIGPVTYPEDQPPQVQDLTVPLEVWIGGKQAQVLFKGRNPCCSALDQINIVVPQGVDGCGTQVNLRIGNYVSNTVNLAIGKPGANNCTLSTSSYGDADFDAILARGSYSVGGVGVTRTTTYSALVPGTPLTESRSDDGSATFTRISGDLRTAFNQAPANPEIGQCLISNFDTAPDIPTIEYTSLDAGASIGIAGPNGNRTMNRSTIEGFTFYGAELGPGTPGNYLDPGNYTFTGSGGAHVGAFNISVAVPPELVWTNRAALTTVTRANGVEVTWTGGNPNGDVFITGNSSVALESGEGVVFASFQCRERNSAGRFTVPAYILLQLPASSSISAGPITIDLPGIMGIATVGDVATANVTGLDFFYAGSQVGVAQSTTYR